MSLHLDCFDPFFSNVRFAMDPFESSAARSFQSLQSCRHILSSFIDVLFVECHESASTTARVETELLRTFTFCDIRETDSQSSIVSEACGDQTE